MKKVIRSFIASLTAAILAVSSMPCIVYAGNASDNEQVSVSAATRAEKNGWYTKDGKKYYFENGEMVVGRTKKINGKLYLFGKTGELLTDGIYTVGGKKYSVDKKGRVDVNKWVKTLYKNSANIYCYAGSDGAITEYKVIKKNKKCTELLIDGKSDISEYFDTDRYNSRKIVVLDHDQYLISRNSIVKPSELFDGASVYKNENGIFKSTMNLFGTRMTMCKDGRIFEYKLATSGGVVYSYNVNNDKVTVQTTKDKMIILDAFFNPINEAGSGGYVEIRYVLNPGKKVKSVSFSVDFYDSKGRYFKTFSSTKRDMECGYDFVENKINYAYISEGYIDDYDVKVKKATITYTDGTSAVVDVIDLT